MFFVLKNQFSSFKVYISYFYEITITKKLFKIKDIKYKK